MKKGRPLTGGGENEFKIPLKRIFTENNLKCLLGQHMNQEPDFQKICKGVQSGGIGQKFRSWK